MASQNYKRVSRNRLCRICGKSDWCSYTPDEKTSFCARVVGNADRVSRTGWGVFYHEKSLFPIEPFSFARRAPLRRPELAPLEIRDFAYRKLIELAPAVSSKEIIDGEKGLRARKILDFENYGSLPRSQAARREIAKEIRRLINRKFPHYVRGQKASISGLPGFWLDKNGRTQLWMDKDYSCPMLLIPYRSAESLIQSCQIRFMYRKLSKSAARYVWLSTPEKSHDLRCGTPLHFASCNTYSRNKPILITEGALKAETASVFTRKFDILASAGVACSHEEIVAATYSREILIAFDTDCRENLFVARAIARLLSLIINASNAGLRNRVKILTWHPDFKGIDDALLENALIIRQSMLEWYKSLNKSCQAEVARILPNCQIGFI